MILLAASCSGTGTEPEPASGDTRVRTTVSALPIRTITGTRTDGESAEGTTVHMTGRDVLYSWTGKADEDGIRFACPAGRYALRATSAVDGAEGMTVGELDTATVAVPLHAVTLPMSYSAEVDIPESGSVHTLDPILLERAVARITYTVEVAGEAGDIRLSGITYRSLPGRTPVMRTGEPNASPRFDSPTERTADPHRHSSEFIMAENLAGTNPAITTEYRKDAEHAPDGASYILISAEKRSAVLHYRIYLGENNTTDFNVRRNTQYILSIVIRGDDTVDTRISGYTLSAVEHISSTVGTYDVALPDGGISVAISGSGSTRFRGAVGLLCGDAESFSVDGSPASGKTDVSHLVSEGENLIPVSYCPEVFTALNSRLSYSLELEDEYGFSRTETFTHTFANAVHLHAARQGEGIACGQCTIGGALDSTVRDGVTVAAVLDGEYTVTAEAGFGYDFEGWYADEARTVLITPLSSFSARADTISRHYYARFDYSSDRITYTSTDHGIVEPDESAFGRVNVDSNVYASGRGTIMFDGDVTEIGYRAFASCSTLEHILLPQTLSQVDAEAFRSCSSLRSIRFPAGVTVISRECLAGCQALRSVQMAAGSFTVSDRAFRNCTALEETGLSKAVTIGAEALYQCSSVRTLDLGSATQIGNWAAAYCGALGSVTFGDSLGRIGKYAFQYCTSLGTISIPSSLTSIGEGAFAHCHSLRRVEFHSASVPSVDGSSTPIFASCTLLSEIAVPAASVTAYRTAWPEYSSIIVAMKGHR